MNRNVIESMLPQQLRSSLISTRGVAYSWERATQRPPQLCRGCWFATFHSRWIRCSNPYESRGCRKRINPTKSKLWPGCHNPFASGKLYKCLQRFLAWEWWLHSWIIYAEMPRCFHIKWSTLNCIYFPVGTLELMLLLDFRNSGLKSVSW